MGLINTAALFTSKNVKFPLYPWERPEEDNFAIMQGLTRDAEYIMIKIILHIIVDFY